MANNFDNRLRNFQKSKFADTGFKRQEYAVKLRKKKRIEAQNNFRFQKSCLDTTVEMDMDFGPTESGDEEEEAELLFYIPEIIKGMEKLNTLDLEDLEISLNYLKNILSAQNPPIKDFVLAGVIPKVLPYTSNLYENKIRYLSLWIFCNIASLDDALCKEQIKKYKIIDIFIDALGEKDEEINENPLWGLSNLIADSQDFCKEILSKDFLNKILDLLNRTQRSTIYLMITWSMCNLCHFESLLDTEMTKKVIQICEKTLKFPKTEIKKKTLNVLAVLIRSDNNKVEIFLNSPIFIESFSYWNESTYYLELIKISSNICSGDHLQTQKLLDFGILDLIYMLIDSDNQEIVSSIYFMLSNIAAGRENQVKILESHVVFYKALNGLVSLDEKIKLEVSFLIKNFMKQASQDLKRKLITDQFMNAIIEALKFNDPEFIINLLTVFQEYISIHGKFEFFDKQYFCIIESLQKHPNETVYLRCEAILQSLESCENYEKVHVSLENQNNKH